MPPGSLPGALQGAAQGLLVAEGGGQKLDERGPVGLAPAPDPARLQRRQGIELQLGEDVGEGFLDLIEPCSNLPGTPNVGYGMCDNHLDSNYRRYKFYGKPNHRYIVYNVSVAISFLSHSQDCDAN